MGFDDVMRQVSDTLERDGSVRAVFGEAIKLEHHTIVPVAVVSGGGGAGGSQGAPAGAFAGGAGLAVAVKPVGFISEHGDRVEFTPIHLEAPDRGLRTEAAAGVRRALEALAGAVSRLGTARRERAAACCAPSTVALGTPASEAPPRRAAPGDDEANLVMSPS